MSAEVTSPEALVTNGVELEQYAAVSTGLAAGFPLDAVLANEGVNPKTWNAARSIWAEQISEAVESASPLGERYDRALAVAQTRYGRKILPLDDDLSQWLSFERQFASAPEPLAVLTRVGLAEPDVLRLHRTWSERIASDPELRLRADAIRRQELAPLVPITIESVTLRVPLSVARLETDETEPVREVDSAHPALDTPLPGSGIEANLALVPNDERHAIRSTPTSSVDPTPGLPSYLIAATNAAAPAIHQLPSSPGNQPTRVEDVNATAELRAIRREPALPFVAGPPTEANRDGATAPELEPRPQHRDPRDERAALPAISRSKPSTPFVSAQVPEAGVAPQNVDSTMEVRAIPRSPALPFQGLPGATTQATVSTSPMPPAPTRDPGDETMAVPAIASLKPSLPFTTASKESQPAPLPEDPSALTLQQYASLCAELSVRREARDVVLKRYGLADEASCKKQDVYWALRMRKNEPLKNQYKELLASFRQHLERSSNRG